MNAKHCLKFMFTSNAAALKKMLGDISENDSHVRADGLCNPIIWQAGHIAWCADYVVWLLGGEKTFPDKWTTLFGYGSKLPEDDAVFPPFSEVRSKLHELQERSNNLLEDFDEKKFADEVELGEDWRMNRLDALLFFGKHDFYHAGQMTVLRKKLGRQ